MRKRTGVTRVALVEYVNVFGCIRDHVNFTISACNGKLQKLTSITTTSCYVIYEDRRPILYTKEIRRRWIPYQNNECERM